MSIFGEGSTAATEELVERALNWMSTNVGALSQAIANRQHVEQWIKTVEAEQKSLHKSDAAHVQEREARASQEYRDALDAFQDAVKIEQKLRYTWQLADTVIDVWRTKAANERRV